MTIALVFTSIFLAWMMFINIFKKKLAYCLAQFFLAISVAVIYFQTGYYGQEFITIACMIIAGYSIIEMVRNKRLT